MNVKMMREVIMSLLLVAVPVLASAQDREASWENLQQLRVGQRIQVVEKDLKKHNGTFTGFSEESIALRVGQDEVGIRRENVLRVSNRERTHHLRNALIGAGLGFAAGLAIGGYVWNEGDGKWDSAGGLVGGGIGGGAGAGAMGAIPSYQTIYRANN